MREQRIPVYGTAYDGKIAVIGFLVLPVNSKTAPWNVERVAMNDGAAIVRISPQVNHA